MRSFSKGLAHYLRFSNSSSGRASSRLLNVQVVVEGVVLCTPSRQSLTMSRHLEQ